MLVAIAPSSFADADPQPLEWLRAAGVEIKPTPFRRRLTEAEITAHLEGVDGLLAGLEPLNRRVLASAGRLKALARVGIGMENVDLAAAAELGIKVTNTPEGPTAAVAEMTLGAALALLRDLPGRNAAVHRREWPKDVVWGLAGLPVLIVGYGRIGRRTAGLLQTLGARILVSDPKVRPEQLAPGEELVSLPEGLRRARMVSLHASGEREILGAAELELLPPGAYLLNSARGGLVNEAAVVAALGEASAAGVPVTIAAGGTGITGGGVPLGGWVLSVEKLTRLEIHPGYAIAGAGVPLRDLQAAAQRGGQFYPPDPTEN